MLRKFISAYRAKARARRAAFIRSTIRLKESEVVVDLGGWDGSHVHEIFPDHKNIIVADVDHHGTLDDIPKTFGYRTVRLDGSGILPFKDQEIDFVLCSSVIEHVTGCRETIEDIRSEKKFRAQAFSEQKKFADEIRRVAKRYYVQTPYRYFPVESHTWLPVLIVLLPRWLLVPAIHLSAKIWIKATVADFRLFTIREYRALFPEAEIRFEKSFGLVKSLMAVRT